MIRLFIIICFLVAAEAGAQQKYWIYFKDKTDSCHRHQDKIDLPVSQIYKDSLNDLGHHIIHQSRWLNAVSVVLKAEQVPHLASLGFVQKVIPINRQLQVLSFSKEGAEFKKALQQTNADTLVQLGLNGEGIKIGIIDGGFLSANESPALDHFFENDGFAGYRNFIEKGDNDPFDGNLLHDDGHGTEVWTMIGGMDPEKNRHYGIASGAVYYLARTDQGNKEYRGEEDFWIAALEWMYDQGVKVINSSLGYSTGFDNPSENYSPAHVDGKSSAITRAATIAAEEKGMILILSAGNEGHSDFKVISIPADARGVIAVGATEFTYWAKQDYSSVGPELLPYIKPDISCYSARGTSFSAPVITGIIAAIMQGYPDFTGQEIINLLHRSGHLYPYPNNYLGYGVPDVRKMLQLLDPVHVPEENIKVKARKNNIQVKVSGREVVLFHKKDSTTVVEQVKTKARNGQIAVRKPQPAIRFTTVASAQEVIEIEWPLMSSEPE